ncbi:MAG: histidine ammonia-lyase [candidate division WOR-3 bacterium]|nr:MAG: histidine ammonia-lyase [candidate division WOR-3 bacterium]
MVVLDGKTLTIEKLVGIAQQGHKVTVKKSLWPKIRRSRAFVDKQVSARKTIYGFNTGFGALARVHIKPSDLTVLQHNIVRSHHAGVGKPFPPEFVRAALALRINTLIKGHSGVSERLVRRLVAMLNKNIIPVVPHKGSVGASGDLAPMAAIGRVLIGEGDVWFRSRKMSARSAWKRAGLKPLDLKPKEGLSLINGTQFSTAVAAMANDAGHRLVDIADLCGALSLDALKGTASAFDTRIFKLRPHPGAIVSARNIKRFLAGSSIIKSHVHCTKVQDPYSLRCMAQVHGACRDMLEAAQRSIEIEMNAVTDNPIVIPEQNVILSNGNFHAEPIAFVLDMMAIAVAECAAISERRTFRMLDSKLSCLQAFLSPKPGLNSGFMMAQVTQAALVSQNKTLCHPASVDSIPTSANQEDHVSMSMNAGLKLLEVIENTTYVLAIEMICACQALDLMKPLKTSPRLEQIKRTIRKYVPFMDHDQPLTDAIETCADLIKTQHLPLN